MAETPTETKETQDTKDQLIAVLTPIFGDSVKKIITEYYDEQKPEEVVKLAHHMLSGYMGEANADKLMQNIMNKKDKADV
jgi:hypothetical protein